MLGNRGFFTFSSPSFSGLMLFCLLKEDIYCSEIQQILILMADNSSESICTDKLSRSDLDLGQEVDAGSFMFEAARLLHFYPKMLHVGEDHILHGLAAT